MWMTFTVPVPVDLAPKEQLYCVHVLPADRRFKSNSYASQL